MLLSVQSIFAAQKIFLVIRLENIIIEEYCLISGTIISSGKKIGLIQDPKECSALIEKFKSGIERKNPTVIYVDAVGLNETENHFGFSVSKLYNLKENTEISWME